MAITREHVAFAAEGRRTCQADRLITIRLRMLIARELEKRGLTAPIAIGTAFVMPGVRASRLLIRHQWREGDVESLQAAAARLGMQAPGS
ncbi:hypothetical protein E2C06_33170 [Dankookia rubra]|uniref:Uncharacterized protein n=1 Tax=Dankookia rubra TaxID=1442381 RepID=A0A4R5Q7S6_9PROT|nr:hypothetical protein [Dankookia rubra]TDH58331.1 hypothetical protein E2C06_33170 [Dankookia rubra]